MHMRRAAAHAFGLVWHCCLHVLVLQARTAGVLSCPSAPQAVAGVMSPAGVAAAMMITAGGLHGGAGR